MSTVITVLLSILGLVGAMAVFIIGLMALDHWHQRRAWRQADKMAREFMRKRQLLCSHGFLDRERCPTCKHFTKIMDFEHADRDVSDDTRPTRGF